MIAVIAARQQDLVTTAQMLSIRLTDSAITRRAARGALHRRHRGVYSLGPAPLSREAQWLAATLGAGEGSALSHESAAELHALSRRRPSLIAVVSTRKRRPEGVRVHRRGDPRHDRAPHARRPRRWCPDLPDPLVNTKLLGIEVDLLWPDRKLVVEIDGAGHGRPPTLREHALKGRVLRAAGYDVLRFTDTEVEEHPERVAAAVSARRPTPSSSCATLPA